MSKANNTSTAEADEADTTIEQDIAELQRLTAWFEGDEFQLDQAIKKYHQAKKLADRIDQRLTDTKNTITLMDGGADS